jgi:hypothetical protein
MAAPTDIELIRHLTGTTEADFADDFVDDLIDRAGSTFGAVSLIWQIQAANFATLVAASSGSTSLQMQQRYEHARDQAMYWEKLAGGISESEIMESVQMAPAGGDESTEYTWDGESWPKEGIWATWEAQD